jgi:hypothetical protein
VTPAATLRNATPGGLAARLGLTFEAPPGYTLVPASALPALDTQLVVALAFGVVDAIPESHRIDCAGDSWVFALRLICCDCRDGGVGCI